MEEAEIQVQETIALTAQEAVIETIGPRHQWNL